MPPPMRMRSALPSSASITPSLSAIFAPPRTTTKGRSGSSVTLRSESTSRSTSSPAAAGSRVASSYTEACLRWTTPKPSETKASPRAASSRAKASRSSSVFAVSPALKRRFSSTATWPSPSAATVSCAEEPTVSVAKATSWPSSSPRRPTTGRREYFSSGSPLGRPRWEITATRAPASTSRVRVGSAARMRPSSVIVVPSSGTLRSARTSTRLPRSSPSESMVFSTVVLLQGFDRGTPERPVGTGDERSPPDADPSGWRPAGSGAVLVVSGTT